MPSPCFSPPVFLRTLHLSSIFIALRNHAALGLLFRTHCLNPQSSGKAQPSSSNHQLNPSLCADPTTSKAQSAKLRTCTAHFCHPPRPCTARLYPVPVAAGSGSVQHSVRVPSRPPHDHRTHPHQRQRDHHRLHSAAPNAEWHPRRFVPLNSHQVGDVPASPTTFHHVALPTLSDASPPAPTPATPLPATTPPGWHPRP